MGSDSMNDIQAVKEPGRDEHKNYLGNDLTSDPFFSENEEHEADPLCIKKEASKDSDEDYISTEIKSKIDLQPVSESYETFNHDFEANQEINEDDLKGEDTDNSNVLNSTSQSLKVNQERKYKGNRYPC